MYLSHRRMGRAQISLTPSNKLSSSGKSEGISSASVDSASPLVLRKTASTSSAPSSLPTSLAGGGACGGNWSWRPGRPPRCSSHARAKIWYSKSNWGKSACGRASEAAAEVGGGEGLGGGGGSRGPMGPARLTARGRWEAGATWWVRGWAGAHQREVVDAHVAEAVRALAQRERQLPAAAREEERIGNEEDGDGRREGELGRGLRGRARGAARVGWTALDGCRMTRQNVTWVEWTASAALRRRCGDGRVPSEGSVPPASLE